MSNKYGIDRETLTRLYWENDPGWSIEDIAKYYGCYGSTVRYYMIKFKIPRREYSEAMTNYFICDWKKENHDEATRTPEYRKIHSKLASKQMNEYWDNEENRKKQSKVAYNTNFKRWGYKQ